MFLYIFSCKILYVIGDASYRRKSTSKNDPEHIAGEVGYALAKAGYRVLCGGLGGCMEAAARGAQRAVAAVQQEENESNAFKNDKNDSAAMVRYTNDSIDVSVRVNCGSGVTVVAVLPFQDGLAGGANPFVDVSLRTNLNTTRNNIIASAADAVVIVGGGAGTLQEAAAAWSAGRMVLSMVGTGGTAERLSGQRLDNRKRLHGPGARLIPQEDDIVYQIHNVDELLLMLEQKLHWYRLEAIRGGKKLPKTHEI